MCARPGCTLYTVYYSAATVSFSKLPLFSSVTHGRQTREPVTESDYWCVHQWMSILSTELFCKPNHITTSR